MKILLCLAGLIGFTFIAGAQVYVSPYLRSDGTYVGGHYRSNADGNFYNNWSTKPNINPYTGSIGTRVTPPSSYGSSFRSYSAPSYNFSTPSYGFSTPSYNSSFGGSRRSSSW